MCDSQTQCNLYDSESDHSRQPPDGIHKPTHSLDSGGGREGSAPPLVIEDLEIDGFTLPAPQKISSKEHTIASLDLSGVNGRARNQQLTQPSTHTTSGMDWQQYATYKAYQQSPRDI